MSVETYQRRPEDRAPIQPEVPRFASRSAGTDPDEFVPFKLFQGTDGNYMKTLMVDYDLMAPGQKYDRLITYLKSYDSWAYDLKSTWMIRTTKDPAQVVEE